MEEGKGPVIITSRNGVDDHDLPEDLNIKLDSLRCANCDRFLLYYAIVEGTIAHKCRRCGCWNIIDARASEAKVDKNGS